MSSENSSAPRRPHRYSAPPPAPRASAGFGIPHELDTPLGLVLWRAVRDVQLCTDTSHAERQRLIRPPTTEVIERFGAAYSEAPELTDALSTFALMLRNPATVDVSELAAACHQVFVWADEKGLKQTALHFAEAAAYADPTDPARANFAARTARRALKRERATEWYSRAHRLASAARNKRESIYALLGYGTMMKDAGNFEEARKAFERGARKAAGCHRRREAAEAYHDLLALALEQRRLKLAGVYARKALWTYPVRHRRFPALAYDVAFLFLLEFRYSGAVSLLDRIVPLIERSEERALVVSALAWAAGSAGWHSRRTDAERVALELLAVHDDYAPGVYIHLADGCRAAGEWERALDFVKQAQQSALERQEPGLAQVALALRAAVERKERPAPEDAETAASGALMRGILARLAKRRGPRPEHG